MPLTPAVMDDERTVITIASGDDCFKTDWKKRGEEKKERELHQSEHLFEKTDEIVLLHAIRANIMILQAW